MVCGFRVRSAARVACGAGIAPSTMAVMAVTDTHPEVEARQIELLRSASPARRFAIVRSLTRTVVMLSRRALRRRRPHATEKELDREFVELHYGEEVARRLLGNK